MKHVYFYETDFGRIGIAEEKNAITNLFLDGGAVPELLAAKETPLIKRAAKQLREYFSGARREFELPLAPEGTVFRGKVWQALLTIPYGRTWSYGALAAAIGNPKAVRAVGQANRHNPIPIIIPCHRVIGADGQLVGYAGATGEKGLDTKRRLLRLERGERQTFTEL